MAWANAFDIGACAVEVYDGPVAFGDLIPEGSYAALGITVNTTGGVVTVAGVEMGWHVRLVPQFDTDTLSFRVLDMDADTTAITLQQTGGLLLGEVVDAVNLSPLIPGYTPDPAEFIDPGEWDAAWISVGPGI